MKFTRKQLLAALAVLTTLPGRLLGGTDSREPESKRWPLHWIPVFESVHPTAQRLILAVLRHEMFTFRYWGGSTPGAERSISPALVFQAGGYGRLYVSGYCHLRRQERVFRLDRVELLAEEDGIICITE